VFYISSLATFLSLLCFSSFALLRSFASPLLRLCRSEGFAEVKKQFGFAEKRKSGERA
jgi:hypothetical protein